MLPTQRNIASFVGAVAASLFNDTWEHSGQLREHQVDAVDDFLDWLTSEPWPEEGKSGYIQMATGAGKTVTFVDIVRALSDENQKPPRTLVLVNKISLLQQTLGDEEMGARGFAHFAPDLNVTTHFSDNKDLTGDVVISTYSSFNSLYEQGELDDDFPLVICDEAHRALGKKTFERLEQFKQGRLFLGFTATPDFGNGKKVDLLFRDLIHRLDLEEAMRKRVVMRPQVWAYRTEGVIQSDNRENLDYTDQELHQLIDLESRNIVAVRFLKEFVEKGLQGVATCIPGKDENGIPVAHARKIAHMANKELIIDPLTGEQRKMRVVAVGSHMSPDEIKECFKDLREAKIDAITGVEIINEGLDADNIKFLLNIRPTRSRVVAEQRLGRVLRLGEHTPQVVEFIDDSNIPQVTAFHLLGVDTILQGSIAGPPPENVDKKDESKTRSVEGDIDRRQSRVTLSVDLSSLIENVNAIKLRELIPEERVIEAPEGYMNTHQIEKLTGVGWLTIRTIAREMGLEPVEIEVPGSGWRNIKHFTLEQVEELRKDARISTPTAPDGYQTIGAIMEEYGLHRIPLENAVERLGINTVTAKDARGSIREFLSPEQVKAIISDPVFVTKAPPDGFMTETEMARRLGIGGAAMKIILNKLGVNSGTYKNPQTGLLNDYYSPDCVLLAAADPLVSTPILSDPSFKSVAALANAWGVNKAQIRKQIKRLGLELHSYKDPYNKRLREYLSPQQQELLATEIGI